jgi:hypothetical protein
MTVELDSLTQEEIELAPLWNRMDLEYELNRLRHARFAVSVKYSYVNEKEEQVRGPRPVEYVAEDLLLALAKLERKLGVLDLYERVREGAAIEKSIARHGDKGGM